MFSAFTQVCGYMYLGRTGRFTNWVDLGEWECLCSGSVCADIVKEYDIMEGKYCVQTNTMPL
jgi:hypothetical protein